MINDAGPHLHRQPQPELHLRHEQHVDLERLRSERVHAGLAGQQIYNQNRYILESALYGNSNGSTRVLGRWTGAGTSNDVPRAIAGDPNSNLRVSSYYVEDGSYLRIKILTLGYTLPKATAEPHRRAKQLRVYVTAQNLVTLTKYTGFDPEVGVARRRPGVYPQSRVFLAGLNIGFLILLTHFHYDVLHHYLEIHRAARLLAHPGPAHGGCGEKFLDEAPTDQVTDANFYKTTTDAIQATNAVYSELGKGGQYNYALWGIGDIMSDNSNTGGGGGGDGIEQQQLDNFNIPTTNPLTTPPVGRLLRRHRPRQHGAAKGARPLQH